jgi:hypothetical protein
MFCKGVNRGQHATCSSFFVLCAGYSTPRKRRPITAPIPAFLTRHMGACPKCSHHIINTGRFLADHDVAISMLCRDVVFALAGWSLLQAGAVSVFRRKVVAF